MTDRLKTELDRLPVAAIAAALNETLRTSAAAIVTAAPGAGKSTLLPLTLLQSLPTRLQSQKIIVLEPRRVAARQIASRMAWLLDENVGKTVGYRIRFESRVSEQTRIEVVTEGVLTRMLLDDPALEGIAMVVFDEFHERSLNTDEAFALTRQCQQLLRDDLRIVVMSATIDTAALEEALRCPMLESEGRMFPVKVIHTQEEADIMNVSQLTAKTILQAHREHEGDILAFLPGEGEIRRVAELLSNSLGNTKIYPLYGLQSNDEQARAIAPSPPGGRKVVLATPIAETSLTIEGVRVVVDSGLCRKMMFDARSGLNRLETVRISTDMATQRTGRAGRVAPGICYRLWSKASEVRMETVRKPEILDADLTSLVLDAAIWGEREVERLPWLTPPPKSSLVHARMLLQSLGALDNEGKVTRQGKALSKLPCHPRIARMLLSADSPQRKSLAADIAALLEEKDPMAGEGDVSAATRLDALRRERKNGQSGRWGRIIKIARQYGEMIHCREDNAPVNPYEVGTFLASAYPERIGKVWKNGAGIFQLSGGELVAVETSDAMVGAEWIVAASMHRKAGGTGKVFLASIVDVSDLHPYATDRESIFWDGKSGSVVARRERRIGNILLESKPLSGDHREAVQQVICEAIVKDGPSMLSFTDEVLNLQRRIAFIATRHPELGLPPVDNDAICQSAPDWGPLYIGKATNTAELKKLDLCEVVWSRLTYDQQQAVDRLAPTHVVVPTGSRIRLEYRIGTEVPVLRVRLQECFGLLDTPLVDGTPVLMELLSPGFKPVQLTTDLRSFWKSTYFDVRKELRRRYPKHAWPDNPLEAEPVRGTKRT
ncbi:MAG: ATP-dependent helicase HrpB [Bacteroidales bacterium]|nr:ATP-dependent helicase HrpB [Bacteroidales bacterium]